MFFGSFTHCSSEIEEDPLKYLLICVNFWKRKTLCIYSYKVFTPRVVPRTSMMFFGSFIYQRHWAIYSQPSDWFIVDSQSSRRILSTFRDRILAKKTRFRFEVIISSSSPPSDCFSFRRTGIPSVYSIVVFTPLYSLLRIPPLRTRISF